MKSNQIVKFIHLLQEFKSIQLLIKAAWGPSVLGSVYNLSIRGAKVKGQNYFTKICVFQFEANVIVVVVSFPSKSIFNKTSSPDITKVLHLEKTLAISALFVIWIFGTSLQEL